MELQKFGFVAKRGLLNFLPRLENQVILYWPQTFQHNYATPNQCINLSPYLSAPYSERQDPWAGTAQVMLSLALKRSDQTCGN